MPIVNIIWALHTQNFSDKHYTMTTQNNSPKHVYLVDASGYIFRAYFGMPKMFRPDGTPTGAVYGFTSMVMKLLGDADADYVGIVFDRARKTFRSDIYPDYKAHRDAPPDDLIPQFGLVREATEAFDLPVLDLDGFEADDLIATYAHHAVDAGAMVTIVSSDKDLMQLVTDKIRLLDPKKNTPIGAEQVVEKFGVTPDKVIDVQALAGDSADNIPGVAGIGVKTASQLINEYGTLENLLENAHQIKQNKRRESLIEQADMARISKQLVTLRTDAPLPAPLAQLKRRPIDMGKVVPFLQEQNFTSLINKFSSDGGLGEHNEVAPQSTETKPITGTVKRNYELVTTLESLNKWIAKARQHGMVAIDTETTSLNTQTAQLVGVSLATGAGDACYIPLRHKGVGADTTDTLPENGTADLFADTTTTGAETNAPNQIPTATALPLLAELFADPAVLKVAHNIKYDRAVLARENIVVEPYDDTLLISFVLAGGKHRHNLDHLSHLHFGETLIKFEDVCGRGKKQITFDYAPLETALDYASEDADMTWRLYHHLKPQLQHEKLCTVYETLERPLVPVLQNMENIGVSVNPTALKNASDNFGKTLADLEHTIHTHAGQDFNIASPKQLGEILFEKLALSGGKKTKTGGYSTSSDVLEKLTEDHPIIAPILHYRTLAKLKSTYSDALFSHINPNSKRVHTSYMMTGTQTGRLSSTEPNLQNIPIKSAEGRMIRDAFVPAHGYTLMCCDYSQIELRLLAEMADIAPLKQAFADGVDIHAMTASRVFGIPLNDMDSDTRRRAKAINFGIIYGISNFGLGKQIGVSSGEAKSFIESYFATFPGIRDFMENTKEFARTHGYVETLFGRRIHLPDITNSNGMMRAHAERQAINAPLQGTSADIIKRAMIHLPPAIANSGLDIRMLLQVHDELVFEVPHTQTDPATTLIKSVMENAPHPARTLSVPLVADVGMGDTWTQAH